MFLQSLKREDTQLLCIYFMASHITYYNGRTDVFLGLCAHHNHHNHEHQYLWQWLMGKLLASNVQPTSMFLEMLFSLFCCRGKMQGAQKMYIKPNLSNSNSRIISNNNTKQALTRQRSMELQLMLGSWIVLSQMKYV